MTLELGIWPIPNLHKYYEFTFYTSHVLQTFLGVVVLTNGVDIVKDDNKSYMVFHILWNAIGLL